MDDNKFSQVEGQSSGAINLTGTLEDRFDQLIPIINRQHSDIIEILNNKQDKSSNIIRRRIGFATTLCIIIIVYLIWIYRTFVSSRKEEDIKYRGGHSDQSIHTIISEQGYSDSEQGYVNERQSHSILKLLKENKNQVTYNIFGGFLLLFTSLTIVVVTSI